MREKEFIHISDSAWPCHTGYINLNFFLCEFNWFGNFMVLNIMVHFQTAMIERTGLDKIHT